MGRPLLSTKMAAKAGFPARPLFEGTGFLRRWAAPSISCDLADVRFSGMRSGRSWPGARGRSFPPGEGRKVLADFLPADAMAHDVFPAVETCLFGPADGAVVMPGKAALLPTDVPIPAMQPHGLPVAHLAFPDFPVDPAVLGLQTVVYLIAPGMIPLECSGSEGRGAQTAEQDGKRDNREFDGWLHGKSSLVCWANGEPSRARFL